MITEQRTASLVAKAQTLSALRNRTSRPTRADVILEARGCEYALALIFSENFRLRLGIGAHLFPPDSKYIAEKLKHIECVSGRCWRVLSKPRDATLYLKLLLPTAR